jgi:hypothetical protein
MNAHASGISVCRAQILGSPPGGSFVDSSFAQSCCNLPISSPTAVEQPSTTISPSSSDDIHATLRVSSVVEAESFCWSRQKQETAPAATRPRTATGEHEVTFYSRTVTTISSFTETIAIPSPKPACPSSTSFDTGSYEDSGFQQSCAHSPAKLGPASQPLQHRATQTVRNKPPTGCPAKSCRCKLASP